MGDEKVTIASVLKDVQWDPLDAIRPALDKLSEHATLLRLAGMEPDISSELTEDGLRITVRPKPPEREEGV